jgi:hypothetical protein
LMAAVRMGRAWCQVICNFGAHNAVRRLITQKIFPFSTERKQMKWYFLNKIMRKPIHEYILFPTYSMRLIQLTGSSKRHKNCYGARDKIMKFAVTIIRMKNIKRIVLNINYVIQQLADKYRLYQKHSYILNVHMLVFWKMID